MYIHSLIKTEYTVIFKFKNVSTTVFLNFKTFTTILDIYDIYDIYIYIYILYTCKFTRKCHSQETFLALSAGK